MLLSFGDIDKIPHKKCLNICDWYNISPTHSSTYTSYPSTPAPVLPLILGIPLAPLVPQLYPCHIPFVPFHTTCCTPWTWRTLLCIVFTQRCWWLPLTPFQILISIQSLHCNVGLLIIDVPRIPLYPVFKYCIPPPPHKSMNKLILNSQQQNTR